MNANGRSILYVFGGLDMDVEAYNIATDRWATRSGIAPVKTLAINGYRRQALWTA